MINIEMYKETYKGTFTPTNPTKYKGDNKVIIYRSSWELRFMNYCDKNPSIIEWSSEEIVIPYKSPIDGRVHRYFVDFYCKIRNKQGVVEKTLIEIKPKKFTKPPVKKKRVTKTYLNEVRQWGINNAKWEAAKRWSKKKGMKFVILTEDILT